MPNPMFSNATSPNGATSPNNPLNDSNKRYKRGYNRFNYNRTFYNTERYADINVIDVVEGVEGDKLPFGNKHDIRSFTLSSPIMFDIFKKKSYFMVDNKAILPINWDKVYKQPNKGDDVTDDVNCVSHMMFGYINRTLQTLYDSGSSFARDKDNYNFMWRFTLLLESIFSNGSLLASMNCHLSSFIVVDNDPSLSFDKWLEDTFSYFDSSANGVITFKIPSLSDKTFTNYTEITSSSNYIYVTTAQALDMLRTYSDFEIIFDESENYTSRFNYLLTRINLLSTSFTPDNYNDWLNLSRLVAYQLVCTQFYTNDSVDNIYNAELFMQNAKDHVLDANNFIGNPFGTVGRWPQFNYNGTDTDYDVFSGAVIDSIFKVISDYATPTGVSVPYENFLSAYQFLHMIFFYRKSLRYGDYFVGAKTLPFAPGDVTAEVVSGGVSALDMTRSILMQRFLNSVNRARNTWKDYLKDVTDGIAPPNPLEPRFLASTTSKVGGFEVENTAENQGNIVTLLKSGNSNYIYEVEVGEPCIIIGVSTYEVPRVYSKTIERFFKHRDRFDMFNKFMQNIGDQEISLGERSAVFSWDRTFGYTPRHMEYKQRYPIASGGFVENLKGYAFITDNYESGQTDDFYNKSGLEISSSYIRNKNSEMDRFYSSLTGLTLASYFHFICKYECICDANRQMEFNPTIL